MSLKVIVVPTYNERGNIEKLLPALLQVDSEIEVVVVDDQSPDGTGDVVAAVAAELGRIHLVRRESKEGLGPAYQSGFRKALDLGADYIVQMDADFSHPIDSLPEMFREAEKNDLVLIAGKGHEDYQIIGTQTIHFDDREVARSALRKRNH